MSGSHTYDDGKPLYPLDLEDVRYLVQRGMLVAPQMNELNDRSKGDALAIGLAIVQTSLFAIQFITRLITHLHITCLEALAVAHTAITAALYTAWWHKPLVSRPA